MAYTMKHILIAAIALLALSMAVVARPEKPDCAAMSNTQKVLEDDLPIHCRNDFPNTCSPSKEEAEWALDLLDSGETWFGCVPKGEFPDCNTPVSTPTIAIQVCANPDKPVIQVPCKDVAKALRPILTTCENRGKVEGSVTEGGLTFAISRPPSIMRACPLAEM